MALLDQILNLIENPSFEVVDVVQLGKVGLRQLTIEARDEWFEAQKNDPNTALSVLFKNTVCDPVSGELALTTLENGRLRKLPTVVEKDLFSKICKANAIKTQEEAKQEEELKNSEAGQN
ncbi:hypothetical protein [Acinetobacter pittii]|uniref:hypothetical protein n=1 Tax=Acinetobacter pittii TaxID=48296 RepID=UPI001023957A|nr:hypothetical protein [Acinetobacter pittii]RZH03153.1 hypothetical protein EXE01_04920 [Acinetobacter pittii]